MNNRIFILSLLMISTSTYAQSVAPSGLPPEGLPHAAPNAVPLENKAATTTENQAAPSSESRIQNAISQLPPEKAGIFEAIMRQNLEKNKSKQQEVRLLYTNIRNNFIGPVFNKEVFLQDSSRARDLQSEIRASLDQDLAEAANKFTQEERQLIFNALPSRYTKDGSSPK